MFTQSPMERQGKWNGFLRARKIAFPLTLPMKREKSPYSVQGVSCTIAKKRLGICFIDWMKGCSCWLIIIPRYLGTFGPWERLPRRMQNTALADMVHRIL